MKNLTLTLLLLLPLALLSQTDSLYVYAELQPGTDSGRSMTVYVNYPKMLKDYEPGILSNNSGSKIFFRTLSGALTMMAADGWEYVDNYTRSAGPRAKTCFIIKKKFHISQIKPLDDSE